MIIITSKFMHCRSNVASYNDIKRDYKKNEKKKLAFGSKHFVHACNDI